jgi:beta-lactamase regulating signal transducer with metallopeptidase domain
MMKNSMKGALLSGLVFPGLGQIALKHYWRGFALILAVMAGLYVMIATAVQQAYAILDNIEAEGGMPDSDTISQAAAQAAAASDSPMITTVSVLILVCWIAGIVDAYRIGKQKDLEGRASGRMAPGAGD